MKNISRRNLLKTTAVFLSVGQLFPAVSLSQKIEQDKAFHLDSDYIVISGWVLLKSDVELS